MVPGEGLVPGRVQSRTGTWGWGAVECLAVDHQPSGAEIMANSKGGLGPRRLGVKGGEGTGAPHGQDGQVLAGSVSLGIGQEWPCGDTC